MAIQSVQLNMEQPQASKKKDFQSYRNASGVVATDNLVKPLPPKGHLIDDTIGNSIKYFFKDIAYDMKSLKNGFNGTANDHQLGRLNDVGLKLGGVGIAAYLASRTSNPRARLMEYVGLITFLTSMSLYPKIAINTPAKIINGFDIDKEYIDDQGRKKSVMQDGNYVPFDMYLGNMKEEDLDAIGDSMGVPRNIKSRHDVIKEQMRKVSVQNNTLWMLTAGFATPVMTALACCAFERYVASATEAARNELCDKKIEKLYDTISNMGKTPKENSALSKAVTSILGAYEGKVLPESEYTTLLSVLTEHMDANVSRGIKSDLENILRQGSDGLFSINAHTGNDIIASIRDRIPKKLTEKLESVVVPSKSEIDAVIQNAGINLKDGQVVTADKLTQIRGAVDDLLKSKFASISDMDSTGLDALRHDMLDSVLNGLEKKKALYLDSKAYKDIRSFADILSEFKVNQNGLDKCKSFKFEAASDTIIARYYEKFEKALFKELGISYGDLRKMRDSSDFTMSILDRKISEICKDEARYSKAMENLGKVISDMEVALNGAKPDEYFIQKLINGIENNYNITAKRLDSLGSFGKTIDMMVKEPVGALKPSTLTRSGSFDLLDGLKDVSSKGLGSSKNLEISRIIDRYAGARNSFYRVLHTFDFYKRTTMNGEFGSVKELASKISEMGKKVLLSATTSDHTLKLDTVNAQKFYKEFMKAVYKIEEENGVKSKGFLTELSKNALGEVNGSEKGQILDRLQYYIAKFRNLMTNYDVDFTKPHHIENPKIPCAYSQEARTRMSMFNLVAQSPVDLAKGAAGRRYGNLKWARMVGGIAATVFGVTVLAQFGFGKISNPHTLFRNRVKKNETNK